MQPKGILPPNVRDMCPGLFLCLEIRLGNYTICSNKIEAYGKPIEDSNDTGWHSCRCASHWSADMQLLINDIILIIFIIFTPLLRCFFVAKKIDKELRQSIIKA